MGAAVARKIDNIKHRGGISAREVAQLLDTTPQTVSRWQTGRSSPQRDSLNRLLRLEWLAEQLSQFYSPDEARLWLFSPHPELGGERPADRIVDDRIDEVLAIIDRLQSAAYS
jgi:transcriptional regulator with XRE-family HTH domain